MKTAMKTLFTTIALSMSALVATSAMAAPQHDPRFAPKHPPAHLDHKKINEFLNDLLCMYFTERQNDIEIAISLREKSTRIKLKIEKTDPVSS